MTVIVSCLSWNKAISLSSFLFRGFLLALPDVFIHYEEMVVPILKSDLCWGSVPGCQPTPLLYSHSSIHPSYVPCHSSHHQFCSLTVILTLKAGGERKWVSLRQPFVTMFRWVWGCIASSLKCLPFLLSSLCLFSPELLWRLKLSLLPSAALTSTCVALSNSDWVAVAFVILGSRPLEIILLLWVQGGLG